MKTKPGFDKEKAFARPSLGEIIIGLALIIVLALNFL